jgi:uncharacterized membrane protein
MAPYIVDWLNLFVRWLHFVAGVAWIGSSFYFIWLDDHLEPPADVDDDAKGVAGEVWSVHGGGFYHAQKYRGAPRKLPSRLHWFKWEAYTTWLSGIFLLALVYWYGAQIYLLPEGDGFSAPTAIVIAAAYIVGGWLIYDVLCKSPLARDTRVFALVLLLLSGVLAWSLCELYSGRGAFIHFGAVLGSIMVANVFFVIIPGQKKMLAAAEHGEVPDPAAGVRGKQRSVHNTYFTLPVLFVMTSNHYAMVYGHGYNWLILVGISLAGALIRVYFVARHRGEASIWPVIIAALIVAGIVWAMAPQRGTTETAAISFAEVRNVINARCVSCHSSAPVHPAVAAAPLGVMFDSDEQIVAGADRIHQQTVVTRVMPIGNLTAMTDEERRIIDAWYQALRSAQ